MQAFLRFLLIIVVLLVGCDASPTSTPQPAPTSTPTTTSISTPQPTPTITLTPQSIPTSTPTSAQPSPLPSTPTRSPTATRIPPTSTPTPKPTAISRVTPTPPPIPSIAVTLPITTWRVSTLLVGPGSPGRLYTLQRGEVFGSTPNVIGVIGELVRLLVSNDFGGTWQSFAGSLPTNDAACLRDVSMDYATVDALYASTCQGIYRWTGTQWTRISEQKTGTVAITYGKPNLLWATGLYPGPYILRSEDGGVTWQRADYFLDTFTGMANLGIDPRDGKTLYSMINPKYAGSYLRRGDTSGRWVTMPVPAQGYTYIGFTVDGATGNMYVASLQENRHWQLWRTTNPTELDVSKVRWELVHDFGDESVDKWVIVLASGRHPQGLALFVRLDVGNCSPLEGIPCASIVKRSLDGGQTWTALPVPTK